MKNVKFASISDQLINTAIIMDMMFNTEMIVKDMKGGKEDMTENKRFTMCHEQNDINGWTMSIVDWQTKEPFNYTTYEVHSSSITDTKDEMEDLCLLLNELNDENEQLISTIKEVIELLSEEVDLFIDKATEYDINGYIKLKELDDKDAFYMVIVTKKAIKMLKELK